MSGNVTLPLTDLAMNRAAVLILAQLPDNLSEALHILDVAREMVTEFLAPHPLDQVSLLPEI